MRESRRWWKRADIVFVGFGWQLKSPRTTVTFCCGRKLRQVSHGIDGGRYIK
jgi:hypothetical protein